MGGRGLLDVVETMEQSARHLQSGLLCTPTTQPWKTYSNQQTLTRGCYKAGRGDYSK